MEREALEYALKEMIIEECEKEDIIPEDIDSKEALFSSKNVLELDSLDALTISMALQKKYALRIGDPKEFRRILTSIEALSEYILQEKNGTHS